jgi:putative spermidine/putrescine transport system ATP-binding protein
MELERTRVDIIACGKTYPDGTIGLHPTTLRIEPGEVLALLGPSGCGKTTLLRLIAGLESPDAGCNIFFGQQNVTTIPIEQRGVGMVFQHYALFPHMSVEANIGYGLRIRGISKDIQRQTVGELIDLVRLNGLEKKRPAELSGGQRQRVALARAVAVRPRVLLLDEPLTALDAKLKESLRTELAELLRRLNITAIHVTHDQHEAMEIADRLAVMQAGRIVQVGDGESLYRSPAHPFVASFLGRVNRLLRDENARKRNIINFAGKEIIFQSEFSNYAELLVRPEDIEVASTEVVHTTSEWGEAVVTRRHFLGDRVHLLLALSDQPELSADVDRDHPARVGDRVGVRIRTDRLMPCLDFIS